MNTNGSVMAVPAATDEEQPIREAERHPASFRDPNGFIFRGASGELLRQVNSTYRDDYRRLMDSGLYDELASKRLLIEHEEVELDACASENAYCVLKPRHLPLISYPYEWAFSGLKDAALLTLDIQKRALRSDMCLKDASSYNIQFDGARPVFIDTLSFEAYQEGSPWSAYGQFCRHFLAPLALIAKTDIELGGLLKQHIDGVPLDLAAKLLPWTTRFNAGLFMHLHMHAKMVSKHSDTSTTASQKKTAKARMSRQALDALIDSLRRTISSLSWNPSGTEWADYYEDNSYSEDGLEQKVKHVTGYVQRIEPATVWDLGANTGMFSRIASSNGAMTCAMDIDPACVERNYRVSRKQNDGWLLPLRMDLTNPSPAIGWAHGERDSLVERGPCDLAMALALIHHLAISNNVPLEYVSEFFGGLCRHLIIEFVPKNDPQVRRLLQSREDIFPNYDIDGFERAFSQSFRIIEQNDVGEDGRVLYLMEAR